MSRDFTFELKIQMHWVGNCGGWWKFSNISFGKCPILSLDSEYHAAGVSGNHFSTFVPMRSMFIVYTC
jgi:hypothetical protein